MSVDLSVENGLAEIVLNRPDKMNALNDAMVAELNGALERAASQGVRAMMIRGEGPAFSAGRDLADAHPGDEDAEAIIETTFNPLIKRIVSFPAPTFAAVHGACLGVGLGIALGCDVVYVADDAKIGSPFARIGAVLDSGGHSFFVSRLGTHRALELIYTGRSAFRASKPRNWDWSIGACRKIRWSRRLGRSRRRLRKDRPRPSCNRSAWCAGSMKRRWACSRF